MGTGDVVLVVLDARTGRQVDLMPPGRRHLRVCVHVDAPGGLLGVRDLRILLVADVLLRAGEAQGLQVFLVRTGPELTPHQAKALEQELIRYSVTPPAEAGLEPGAVDVHVASRTTRGAGAWLMVGEAATGSAAQLVGNGEVDHLALRLALLSRPHAAAAGLPGEKLALAARTLAHYRTAVARWAHTPSSPVPEPLQRRIRGAVAADLDTPALVELLKEIESHPLLGDGARFETFALVDRVLGVGLTRDIGR
ncbi:hypothetical protein [Streptacidiphilus monticola]|uniref:Cysteinyl-tRNA synthetase n=1 Tax=Streptacidiphilus monticola TaxID=2161674 RepID=A0ABW1G8M1_9ACTN